MHRGRFRGQDVAAKVLRRPLRMLMSQPSPGSQAHAPETFGVALCCAPAVAGPATAGCGVRVRTKEGISVSGLEPWQGPQTVATTIVPPTEESQGFVTVAGRRAGEWGVLPLSPCD